MQINLFDILYYIVLSLATLFSLFLFLKYKKKNDYIFLYLFINWLIEGLLYVQVYFSFEVITIHKYYTFLDIFTMSFFTYYLYLQINNKKIFYFFIIMFATYLFACEFHFNSINSFNEVVFSFYLIILSIIYYINLLTDVKVQKIFEIPSFWIFSAILMWSIFYLFRYIPRLYLHNQEERFMNNIRNLFQIINVITYSAFIIALLKYKNYNHE